MLYVRYDGYLLRIQNDEGKIMANVHDVCTSGKRIESIESVITEIKDTMKEISKNMEVLARVDEKVKTIKDDISDLQKQMDKLEERVRKVEDSCNKSSWALSGAGNLIWKLLTVALAILSAYLGYKQ